MRRYLQEAKEISGAPKSAPSTKEQVGDKLKSALPTPGDLRDKIVGSSLTENAPSVQFGS